MNIAFVLHTHMPWLRRNGTYPAGEEWLFQAWAESYLPLIEVLERLAADGLRDVLTLGVTPVLDEQLDDPYLLREFHGWLGRRLLDLEHSAARYGGHQGRELGPVWTYHWRRQQHLLDLFESRFLATGLARPLRDLAGEGVIQLLGGPTTHPYLPLMNDPLLIEGQIEAGMAAHQDRFGGRPTGAWTPECAYRPAGPVQDPTDPQGGPAGDLPGLESYWGDAGITHLVLDGPTLARAAGAGDRDWSSVGGDLDPPGGALDVLDEAVLIGDSEVAAFGRNLSVSYAVWNPHGGYPADPWYRDFYAVDLEGGFKSWRVTDRGRWDKDVYQPAAGHGRAHEHAREFVDLLHRYGHARPESATVVAAFDTELFGHWWYEGPTWLESALRRIAADPRLRTTTLSAAVERHPPRRRLHLAESSWGRGKGHGAWVSTETRWIWAALRDAERRFAALEPGRARDAAWRQLTLLQASDWPFLVARDESTQYAQERVRAHLERFDQAYRGEGLAELGARDGTAPAPAASTAVR